MSYVNFNRHYTRAELAALTTATEGKIYFATDGGIYVGKADGTAELKANISEKEIFVAQVEVTTFQECVTAYNAGKILVAVENGNPPDNIIYSLELYDNSEEGMFYFKSIFRDEVDAWSLDYTDTWTFVFYKVQKELVSGTNIKTINSQSILGSGDITINADTSDCVKYTQQSKTDAEKTIAQTNIGLTFHDDVEDATPDPPIATSYGQIGVVSQTLVASGGHANGITWTTSNPVTGLIPQVFIDLVTEAGATYTGDLVTVDGNITTGEGPAAAFPYAYELLTQLVDKKTSDQIAEGMRFKHLMSK
jgi:hypothetical protein